jgi:cobalamin biosynthesis protein CobT
MTKGHTTINLDTKSQLAKLLATENIIIQHNNVSTASFNTKTRVLTLPIFKEQSGDVYDMLIAHECAHALFTPQGGWKKIQDDDELRTYVNVLEDTRIDKKIQKKYPGVVRNYISGFDILEKQNFFALKGKDINKDLMIIDKINIRSKSSDRLPFIFDNKAKQWLKKVDAIKSFTDVVRVAKEMLNWQKKQVDQMKKLPNFDEHPITVNYDLDDTPPEEQPKDEGKSNEKEMSDGESKESEEDKKKDDLNEQNNTADSDEKKDKDKEETKKAEPTKHAKGAGGCHPKKKLKSITNDSFEQKKRFIVR